jgi:hypothetical protein
MNIKEISSKRISCGLTEISARCTRKFKGVLFRVSVYAFGLFGLVASLAIMNKEQA